MSDYDQQPKRLGSLAQSARSKKLNQVRGILIVIGALTLIVNVVQLFLIRDIAKRAIDEEIRKKGPGVVVNQTERQRVEDQIVRIGTIVCVRWPPSGCSTSSSASSSTTTRWRSRSPAW
jgi:hypothetical protein